MRIGAVREDRGGGAVGQALVHRERLVRRREELAHGGAQHIRHTLTAVLFGHVKAGPAACPDLIEGRLESGGRIDDAIF